jgi:hypothetical protein
VAKGGHLAVLQWAHANDFVWAAYACWGGGSGGWAPRGAAVGAFERLSLKLGPAHTTIVGDGRAPRRATVAEGKRVRVARNHVQCGGKRWSHRCATMGVG